RQFAAKNERLADAEDVHIGAIQAQMTFAQTNNIKPRTKELVDERKRLRAAEWQAATLEEARKNELYAVGDKILADQYGGPYGTLQKNWIDLKNTPSYLEGLVPAAIKGAVNTVKAGAGWLYDRATGVPLTPTPAPDPVAQHNARMNER